MVTSDPHTALVVAHQHAHDLHEEAAAERFRRAAGAHRALAATLRRLADRLDPDRLDSAPFSPHPA